MKSAAYKKMISFIYYYHQLKGFDYFIIYLFIIYYKCDYYIYSLCHKNVHNLLFGMMQNMNQILQNDPNENIFTPNTDHSGSDDSTSDSGSDIDSILI